MLRILLDPLSPNLYIQILLTDLHALSYSSSWENLLKDQSNFILVIILLILITFSLDYVLIL